MLVITRTDYSAAVMSGGLALFNVNAEVSIPTWYSQTLLLTAAGLVFLCARAAKRYKPHWYILSAIFLFMSIDEGASIHELASSPMRQLLNVQSGPLYYSWVVLYGLLALLFGLAYIKFLKHLPRKTALLMILAGAIFVTGAIGFEMVGAGIAAQSGEISETYSLIVMLEEYFEMVGASVFIYALLTHLKHTKTTIALDFK